ncbi:hypothetical protein ABZ826_23685 [Streptomyces sp. NPDC047515]|uniref:hypothetical protein n=1 Tax=Streptomyces sp. NPDC047515 TaxID=3155380 RepID=UPI0033D84944
MTLTIAAVLTTVALTAGLYCWWQIRSARRALILERAARRLTEASQHRDVTEFRRRIDAAIAEQRVLEAADRIVDAELARTTRHNPKEGDTP